VSEIAPKEVSGPAGSIMQVSVVVGGLIPTAIGLITIDEDNKSLQKSILEIMIAIPAAVSVLQILLLLTVYRVDTPTYYQQKGDMANVRRALAFVYKPYAIE
jgi:ethanolamine transporter EutH